MSANHENLRKTKFAVRLLFVLCILVLAIALPFKFPSYSFLIHLAAMCLFCITAGLITGLEWENHGVSEDAHRVTRRFFPLLISSYAAINAVNVIGQSYRIIIGITVITVVALALAGYGSFFIGRSVNHRRSS